MRAASLRSTSHEVGRRIAELRIGRALTQAAFAEEAGVSLRYLQSVEAGRNLTLDSLVKFSNVLRVAVIELFRPPRTNGSRRGRPPIRHIEQDQASVLALERFPDVLDITLADLLAEGRRTPGAVTAARVRRLQADLSRLEPDSRALVVKSLDRLMTALLRFENTAIPVRAAAERKSTWAGRRRR